MKWLTPWIIPNHKLEEFCSSPYWGDNYFIDSIMRHDEKNYCIVTNGSYPFVSNELRKLLDESNSD
jgi:hypothetical protein